MDVVTGRWSDDQRQMACNNWRRKDVRQRKIEIEKNVNRQLTIDDRMYNDSAEGRWSGGWLQLVCGALLVV
uniref:Uncharacterized protein n=1 Tax=Cucumis melo TaxID=3656 RepID=A0A9I9E0K3_CUCME